jgi:hypothetical protein
MKKIMLIRLSLISLLFVAGCSGDNKNNNSEGNPAGEMYDSTVDRTGENENADRSAVQGMNGNNVAPGTADTSNYNNSTNGTGSHQGGSSTTRDTSSH